MNKDELREKMKIRRRTFQSVRREAADGEIARIFLAAYGGYDSFLIYNAFGSEAGTAHLIGLLTRADKQVYLPRVEGEDLVAVPFGRTEKGAFGIGEPTGEAFAGEIDVTVAPLLAVNGRGFRVGYGKGFYDRYFKTRKTVRVGLGYAFQMEEFDEDGWDEPLDAFVCERGIFTFGKDR